VRAVDCDRKDALQYGSAGTNCTLVRKAHAYVDRVAGGNVGPGSREVQHEALVQCRGVQHEALVQCRGVQHEALVQCRGVQHESLMHMWGESLEPCEM
jgi:hypothetical protein